MHIAPIVDRLWPIRHQPLRGCAVPREVVMLSLHFFAEWSSI